MEVRSEIDLGDQLVRFLASLPRPVRHVTADSRQVSPDTVFVAVPGNTLDGHDFVHQAIQNGAVAAVVQRPGWQLSVPWLTVDDSRLALAFISAWLHHFPARRLVMVGVTGTDGKTTTVNLVYRILLAAGIRAGMISTVNADLGGRVEETGLHVTTPDAPEVQRLLADMVRLGLTHCVLEATSHGLAQHRVAFCDFDVAVVTNITHEHLDFHGDPQSYRAAKARLFHSLSSAARKPAQAKTAVLNADDSSYVELVRIPVEQQIGYALSGTAPYARADLTARCIQYDRTGTCFDLVLGDQACSVESRLVGAANVSNILAAAGATWALGIPLDTVRQGIADLPGIPGRMERIEGGQPFQVVVDFAHTPNALERVIETGRQTVGPRHRVITVFGSAGLRDRAKRHAMGEISARNADLTVITAEDPRTESLEAIMEEMAAGCRDGGGIEGSTFFRVPDRMRAIFHAFALARPGDLVLICGKGHEQSMCFGTTEYPWDDRYAARQALDALAKGSTPVNSNLPTAHP